MRSHPVPLALLGLAVALPAALLPLSARADCAASSPPKVTVKIVDDPIVWDRSLTIAQLSKLPTASRRPGAGLEGYDHSLGLTEAEMRASASLDMETTPQADGSYCTAATASTVTLEWTTRVRLAAEMQPGTCVYDAVKTHELGHVQIDRDLEPVARREIADAVSKAIARPAGGASIDATRAAIRDRARQALNAAMDGLTAERRTRQLAHDTKAEYDKIPKACGEAAFQRLLRGG